MIRSSLRFLAVALIAAAMHPLPLHAAAQLDNIAAQTDIEFVAGTGPVIALDPDNPDIPFHGDSTNIHVNTATVRALSLNVVPNLTFANSDGTPFPTVTIGGGRYPLYKPVRPYIQVSDLRGTGNGWKLTACAEQFRRNKAPSLPKAQIRLIQGTSRSSNDELQPLDIPSQIILECSDDCLPVTIADTLGTGSGMGTWVIRWYPLDESGNHTASTPAYQSFIDLQIPGEALILPGIYTTTITWTLTDSV